MTQFGWILDVFEDFSILAEKQQLKTKEFNSLKNFFALDTIVDSHLVKLVKWNKSEVKKTSVQMAVEVH